MLFDKDRKQASPKLEGVCPCCNEKVIAKCGSINIWHWAHKSLAECDSWYEPMSQWHLDWQLLAEEEYREVVVGCHRADIKSPSGVIELQKSSMSVEEVAEREGHYGDMCWVFDATDFQKSLIMKEKVSQRGNRYFSFRWKRPRQYIVNTTKPVYFDFGDTIFKLFQNKEKTGYFTSYASEYDGKEYKKWYGAGFHMQKDHDTFNEILGMAYNFDYVEK